MRGAGTPTLEICVECGQRALVGRGIDEHGVVRWLCRECFVEDLTAMRERLERLERLSGRDR